MREDNDCGTDKNHKDPQSGSVKGNLSQEKKAESPRLPQFRGTNPTTIPIINSVCLLFSFFMVAFLVWAVHYGERGPRFVGGVLVSLAFMVLINVPVWLHIIFLVRMESASRPKGVVLRLLTVKGKDRPTVKRVVYPLIVLTTLTSVGFVGTLDLRENPLPLSLPLTILGMNILLFYSALSSSINYLFTDKGFGIFLGNKNPLLTFFPWTSFTGFKRKEGIIKLRPRCRSLLPRGFSVEAGEAAEELEAILREIFPREP
jgi:hypothetical protein